MTKPQHKDLGMDEIILKRLEAECFGHRTIEIYGGAYHLARRDNYSLADIAIGAVCAINNAKFWEPKVSEATIAQRFCSLFFVDHMLIEAYIGVRF
mgnify:CR=1 FL=1